MHSNKLAQGRVSASTQRYLDIAEIKNDCLILKDGSLRSVLLVSSVNFSLKSLDEQNAIIGAYVSFLNSIDFPIQIVIQSRKLNIDKYLEKIKKLERLQTNPLLRLQMIDYGDFVAEMVEMHDIMTKRFFTIVPYSVMTDIKKSFFQRLKDILSPAFLLKLNVKEFMKRKRDLDIRTDHVSNGLQSMGLFSQRLDTQSLVELFYNFYNPETSPQQPLPDKDKLRIEEL